MDKIYYDQDGVKVTSKVFTTPEGKSYPIKTITSVSISSWVNFLILLPAILFTFIGLVTFNSQIGMVLLAVGITFIYLTIKFAKWNLKMNSNDIGSHTTAMSLSKRDKTNEAKMKAIQAAILEAVSNVE